MIEVLTDNHYQAIIELFDRATRSIKIISPFLTESMADQLCMTVETKRVSCTFITRFYVDDMLNHVNSIDALEKMRMAGIDVYAVKGLHTKLYLFDDETAILGSANFTSSGLKTNIELSLLFSQEQDVVDDLNNYWNELLKQILQNGDGLVTDAMIKDAREKLQRLWKANKAAGTTTSIQMYGASLSKKTDFSPGEALEEIRRGKGESDAVFDIFREAEVMSEIKYSHTIWLKFDGEADARIDGNEQFPMVKVELNGKAIYIQNYPRRPTSVKDGDEVYLAAITTDVFGKNQPVIMGRGKIFGFRPNNKVAQSWLPENPWMARYPWYCVIEYCEVLNTTVNNGIPLDTVLEKLGSNTYLVSFGRNEDIPTVSKKHHQKAHIRLSGNAKEEIDRLFEKLKKKYGVLDYHSEI